MTEAVGHERYLEQLQALMPRGRAWTRDPDALLTKLLRGLARSLAALDLKAVQLLADADPARTTDLIEEWEKLAGLPDDCTEPLSGLAVRRAAVLDRLVARADLNPATIIALAASYGLTVTVDEHDQARAGLIAGLDVSGGKWRYVWWVTISADSSRFFNVLSDVVTPLLDFDVSGEFQCRLRKLSPAHTHLEIVVNLS